MKLELKVPPGHLAERKYLPTFAELVDRLSIVQLKSVFIPEYKAAYDAERADIEHDIDLMLAERDYRMTAKDIRAVMIVMLANRVIWEGEGEVRRTGVDNGKLLATHSINGVRNTAKNFLQQRFGGRQDLKTDCLAADLPKQFGNWDVFK